MGTTLFTSCYLPLIKKQQPSSSSSSHFMIANSSSSPELEKLGPRKTVAGAMAAGALQEHHHHHIHQEESVRNCVLMLKRRSAVVSLISSSLVFGCSPGEGLAVVGQGLLAGRVPGLSEPMNKTGWKTDRRPDEKSGGHGVGWSPIIPYAFAVPPGWEEVPVSIADLGGTEIDLRFGSSKQGRVSVIVAPVLRFADNLGDNATIELVGPPEKVISAFGPEVIGENVEGKVLSTHVTEHAGRKYYQFELEPPHVLITATAAGNRLYLFNVTGNGLQWKRYYPDLKKIAESFRVL